MNRIVSSLIALLVLLSIPGSTPRADGLPSDVCSGFYLDVPVDSTVASAAIVSNLLGFRSSLRTASLRMLEEAQEAASLAQAPQDFCPSICRVNREPQVVFESGPRSRLDSYGDRSKCEQKLQDTTEAPLLYENRSFDSADGAVDWLTSFARGRGRDGNDMFDRCDGQCSPDYTCVIEQRGDRVVMNTAVVCGHARDRSDNQFDLSYSLRWTCQER